jgi:hypothetical protein
MKPETKVRFNVEMRMLVQHVAPSRGRPYVHRASLDCLQEVCWELESRGSGGATLSELWAVLSFACTPIHVCLAFLQERGLLEKVRRRNIAAPCLLEHAMTEYYALAEAPGASVA